MVEADLLQHRETVRPMRGMVSTELKYFREFNVENRLTGDAGFLTVSLPLSVGH